MPEDRGRGGSRGDRSGGPRRGASDRSGRSASGRRGGGGRESSRRDGDRRGGRSSGRPSGGGQRRDRADREAVPRSAEQERYDGPPIPDQVTGKELDPSVRSQLAGLPERLALRVARHLVAAGLLIGDEPETAHQHALAARARAGRLAVVREAVGETAYAAGEYSEALTELRAARRMNGSSDYVAMMADCERALGKPDRALDLLRRTKREGLSSELQAEMTIVEAGARSDRGELDAALRTLEQAPLMSASREAWVARLRYAYADTLLAAGRAADALSWFHRTEAVDGERLTDAAERAAEVEKQLESQ